MAKVAEVLVQTLIEAGVKRVYGVAGDSLNGMTETTRKNDRLSGYTYAMRRWPPLRQEPRHISRTRSPSVPEVAVQETSTLLTGF
jgi:hypothetical protein